MSPDIPTLTYHPNQFRFIKVGPVIDAIAVSYCNVLITANDESIISPDWATKNTIDASVFQPFKM